MENIVPETLSYKFGAETVEVKPLSVKQTIELSRLLSKQIRDISKSIEEDALKEMSFTELLDEVFLSEENITSLLVLITGKDVKFFKQNFKLSSALKLIREVFKKEEIDEVFTEKLQIAQMLMKVYLGK